MPTPAPRHLARPRRPWRLLLFVFGLTTVSWPLWWPRPPCCPSPNQRACRVPGVALPTVPTKPAPTSTSTTTTAPREPTTTPPSTTPNPWAASRQQTDHDHRTGHRPRAGHRRWRQQPRRLRCWRHHPARRDRAIDHGRAHHHRAIDHGSVHDHAGDHDQHRTHHRADHHHRADQHRADHDRRRTEHDRAGNNHDRTSDPARQPTSKPLGRRPSVRSCPSWLCCTCWAAGSTSRRDTRQAAPRQPPRRRG